MAAKADKLTPIAQRKFNEIVKYLKKHRKFEEIDKTLIYVFANAYESYIKYAKVVEAEGSVLESDKGNKYIHPASNIMQQASNTMRSLNRELGVGQLARDKLNMTSQKEVDPMEVLIHGLDTNGKQTKTS